MSRFPIQEKRIYPRKDLDYYLVKYLEEVSGRKLTKLRYLSPIENPPFHRWMLEGIRNISYTNNTGNKLSHLHEAIRLPLQEYYKENLLRVLTLQNNLVLDFQNKDDIYLKCPEGWYEEWKDRNPSTFRSAEEKLIRVPYIKLYW